MFSWFLPRDLRDWWKNGKRVTYIYPILVGIMNMKGNKLQKLTNLQHESDIQCLFVYKIENLKPNAKLWSIDTIREGKRRPYLFKKHQSKLRILFVHARQTMQYLVNMHVYSENIIRYSTHHKKSTYRCL